MADRGFAAQLAEDLGPEGLRMVLGVFRTDVERLTGVLAATAGAGEVLAFRRAAHGLAGAAGAVGAAALEQACRAGMALHEASPEELAAAQDAIRVAADAALLDLAALLSSLDPPA